jgi:hypothetical protein
MCVLMRMLPRITIPPHTTAARSPYTTCRSYPATVQPSCEELADVTLVANRLWDLDANKAQPGKDYALDPGHPYITMRLGGPAQPLFKW